MKRSSRRTRLNRPSAVSANILPKMNIYKITPVSKYRRDAKHPRETRKSIPTATCVTLGREGMQWSHIPPVSKPRSFAFATRAFSRSALATKRVFLDKDILSAKRQVGKWFGRRRSRQQFGTR